MVLMILSFIFSFFYLFFLINVMAKVKDNSITFFYILRDNPALCDGAGE